METTNRPTRQILVKNAARGTFWGALLGFISLYVLFSAGWFQSWFTRGFPLFGTVITTLAGVFIYSLIPGGIFGAIAGLVVGLSNGIVLITLSRLPARISHHPTIYVGSVIVVMIAAFILSFATLYLILRPNMGIDRWSASPLVIASSLVAAAAAGFAYQRRLRRLQSMNKNTKVALPTPE
jgi:hypothetical protein